MNRASQAVLLSGEPDRAWALLGPTGAGNGDLTLDLGDTKALVLVWEAPRGAHRTAFLGQHLGMDVRHVFVTRKKGWYLAPFKYLAQTFMTLALLLRNRYRLILVQSPPIFAALAVYLYALIEGARFVIDAHTGSLLPDVWQWSMPLHRFLSRRAITTIVTNEHLKRQVASWGASSFLLRDIPAILPDNLVSPWPVDGFAVVFVSSACRDEPLDQVLLAAEAMPAFVFFVTGDVGGGSQVGSQKSVPANVHFTGYLPDAEYFGLLSAAHVVMSLTTSDHTMQSGASEALWLGRPVITSDWPLLRAYFDKGAIHVDNTALGIRLALTRMKNDLPRFEAGIRILRQERLREWLDGAQGLVRLIQECGSC